MSAVSRRVLKFGGTSVGSADALRSAAAIVEAAARERPLVVVVSALAGVTNLLEAAAAGASAGSLDTAGFSAAIADRHHALLSAVARGRSRPRAQAAIAERLTELRRILSGLQGAPAEASAPARAAVLAAGERLSAPIAAAALQSRGLDARVLDAAALLRTDGAWLEAAVDLDATRRLACEALRALPPRAVPVVTGFIGGTAGGETTLLGRGGSDLTASVLGWALEAERVEIWSDVDGVLTADPRTDPGARRIARLSYPQAGELARRGARVLHPRTLEPLEQAAIPVFVGNTLRPHGPGTWIGPAPAASDRETESAA